MSIQPNRVIHRIVSQVDESDWPALSSRILFSSDAQETLRIYHSSTHERYATPLHFWVHALRDELAATGRRGDLVGAAGHAMCRNQSVSEWLDAVESFGVEAGRGASSEEGVRACLGIGAVSPEPGSAHAYCMLESECRRSSVLEDRDTLYAFFWGHGAAASWRRSAMAGVTSDR